MALTIPQVRAAWERHLAATPMPCPNQYTRCPGHMVVWQVSDWFVIVACPDCNWSETEYNEHELGAPTSALWDQVMTAYLT